MHKRAHPDLLGHTSKDMFDVKTAYHPKNTILSMVVAAPYYGDGSFLRWNWGCSHNNGDYG